MEWEGTAGPGGDGGAKGGAQIQFEFYEPEAEVGRQPQTAPASIGQQSKTPSRQVSAPSLSTPASLKSGSLTMTTFFGDGTRHKVKSLAGGKCWICETEVKGLDACHIIAQANQDTDELRKKNLLPNFSINSVDNGIALCKGCDYAFDLPVPYAILVPINLEFFLEFEKQDYNQREISPRQRFSPELAFCRENVRQDPNISPTIKDRLAFERGIPYRLFQRKDLVGSSRRPEPLGEVSGGPKFWHGTPQAAILHAARVTSFPSSSDWLPTSIRQTLTELIFAWCRELPTSAVGTSLRSPRTNLSGASPNQGAPSHHSDDNNPANRSLPSSTPSRSYGAGGGAAATGNVGQGSQVDAVDEAGVEDVFGGTDEPDDQAPELWRFGPSYTSDDAIALLASVSAACGTGFNTPTSYPRPHSSPTLQL